MQKGASVVWGALSGVRVMAIEWYEMPSYPTGIQSGDMWQAPWGEQLRWMPSTAVSVWWPDTTRGMRSTPLVASLIACWNDEGSPFYSHIAPADELVSLGPISH